MRPIANFAIHALAATALIAVAATSAAGAILVLIGHITSKPVEDQAARQQFEVESFSWGAASPGPADLGASEKATVGGVRTQSGQVTGKPQQKATGSIYGGLLIGTAIGDAIPLERGSLTVKGSFPGCVVGDRYADAVLQSAIARYELKDVIITSCALPSMSGGSEPMPMESISFNYAKITYSPIKQDTKQAPEPKAAPKWEQPKQ